MDCIPTLYLIKDSDATTFKPRKGYGCVYSYETCGKRYVGQTKSNLSIRMSAHSNQSQYRHIDDITTKFGWTDLRIHATAPLESLDELESYFIATLDTFYPQGWNHIDGGKIDFRMSVESREKISKAKTGMEFTEEHRQHLREAKLGTKLSEETRRKLSEVRRGKPRSEETRRKIAEANTGKTPSEETRAKISSTLKTYYKENGGTRTGSHLTEEQKKHLSEINSGAGNPNYGKPRPQETTDKIVKKLMKPIDQYSKDGQFIRRFESIKQASYELGICDSTISACAKGKVKSAGGFIWKYVNKGE